MTNEEMQKAIGFIIEHEAKSSAKIDALAENQTRTDEGIRALLSIAEIHEREIETLGESTERVTQGLGILSQEILKLSEATRDTDERLNALINIVERDISERRNGKP